MRTWRWLTLLSVVVAGALAVGCGEAAAPDSGSTGAAEAPAESPAPASTPPAAAAEPQTVAELFPPGPGRDQLLNNCSACHNLACSAIGQRTPDRWDSLMESHRDKIAPAELEPIFTYLKANFDNTKPEPTVPPRFLEGGCTPF